MRNGNIAIFDSDFLSSVNDYNMSSHWLEEMDVGPEQSSLLTLLQNEIPNSLVGNYCIGNYFAVQKSPYAHKDLIELTFKKPRETVNNALSINKIRFKDLIHRFLGENEARSFQKKLIKINGGFAAHYPINWGWRASGSVSISGAAMGCLCLLDTLVEKKLTKNNLVKSVFKKTGVSGLHVYNYSDVWMRRYLKTFTFDTINSNPDLDIFDWAVVDKILHEYFDENIIHHHNTVSCLLDISLAKMTFVNKLGQ